MNFCMTGKNRKHKAQGPYLSHDGGPLPILGNPGQENL